MKNNRQLFNLAIIAINLFRPLLSFLMFYRFFLFRMVDVTTIFLAYLLLDSVEGIIVYRHRGIWGPVKITVHYINEAFFIFSVISGILLRLPLFNILEQLGINIENADTVEVWLACTLIVFSGAVVFGIAMNSVWGNIQNFAVRFTFLAYCCYNLWPDRAVLIPFIAIAAYCILAVEIKKYGWSLEELRKKDLRFRHDN